MTHPTPVPTSQAEQDRIKRGAKVTLEIRKQFQGRIVEANEERVTLLFEGTEALDQQMTTVDANVAHLVIVIGHQPVAIDFSVLLFLNNPQATAAEGPGGGCFGMLAFFENPEHAGHEVAQFRVPLTQELKELQVSVQTPLTVTVLPVALPGRTRQPQVLQVTATIDLVKSTVERQQ